MNARRSYSEVAVALQGESTERLLRLLDSPSIKVGDTAASVLSSRDAHDVVFEGIQQGRLRTSLGRKRALFILLQLGRAYPHSLDACLGLVNDRSRVVVEQALWGIVLWGEQGSLSALEAVRHGRHANCVELAIRAIESHDPQVFFPYYADVEGKWVTSESALESPLSSD